MENEINFEQELYKAFGRVKDFTLGMRIASWFYEMGRNHQEPVSEELEEAASRYAKEEYNHKSPATLHDRCKGCYAPLMYAFKAGANWQKEKDMQKFLHSETATFTREEFDTEMEEVRKQTEKQMMKDAIEGVITFDYYDSGDKTYGCIAHDSFCLEDRGLKDMDKVKIVIIKED